MVESDDPARVVTDWRRMLVQQGVFTAKSFPEGTAEEILGEIVRNGRRVIISAMFGEGGPTVGQLVGYRAVSHPMIDFQFCFPFEQTRSEAAKYLGDLGPYGLQGWWYLPLFDRESVEAVIDHQVAEGFAKADAKARADIWRLSGGYVPLVRFFLRNSEKVQEDSWAEAEPSHAMAAIWEGLGEASRRWVLDLAAGRAVGKPTEYIESTRLAARNGERYALFSPLFGEYVRALSHQAQPQVREAEGSVWVGQRQVATVLSPQENVVFKLLWDRGGEVVLRDEIAKVMWGGRAAEKYSDWAIDQVVRRIRTKIGDTDEERRMIAVVRDRGFCLNRG